MSKFFEACRSVTAKYRADNRLPPLAEPNETAAAENIAPGVRSLGAEAAPPAAAPIDQDSELYRRLSKCRWSPDGDGGPYETSCGHYFEITDGSPTDNSFKFCCYCGKELIDVPYVEEADDDEQTEQDAYARKRGFSSIDELLDDPRTGQAREINRKGGFE